MSNWSFACCPNTVTIRAHHNRMLIIAALASLAFVWLAFVVVNGETVAFDNSVRQAVHSFASPALTRVMLVLTFIGTNGFMAVVGAAFVWWLIKTCRIRDAVWLIAVQIGANLLLQILQFAFHRLRPEPFFGLAKPTSYSFPSGHALLSTVFYLSLAFVMTRNRVIRIAAALLALCIGLSRVYLGVHYPTDVLAGFAAGAFWLSVWVYGIRNVPMG
jgi:undecaprenyl-diphosphatase